MTLSQKQAVFTFNVHKLIEFTFKIGFTLTFGEVFRTPEQQKIYFDSGRSKTMNSMHLQRLAVDFNIFKDGVLLNDPKLIKELGDYWELLNTKNRWGGRFTTLSDPYHFEQQL